MGLAMLQTHLLNLAQFTVPLTVLNHNRIVGGIYALLHTGVRTTRCEAFNSDMRLLVKTNGLYTYPSLQDYVMIHQDRVYIEYQHKQADGRWVLTELTQHELLCGNIYSALRLAASGKSCIAFASNLKLLIEAHGLYTYPGSMLICGKPKFEKGRTDTVLNPVVLVEVLSKSTREYDRGQKFEFYQTIPTFQEYILIDQERVYVEHYHKVKDGTWLLTILRELDARLTLQSISLEISLRQLYENVDWLVAA